MNMILLALLFLLTLPPKCNYCLIHTTLNSEFFERSLKSLVTHVFSMSQAWIFVCFG